MCIFLKRNCASFFIIDKFIISGGLAVNKEFVNTNRLKLTLDAEKGIYLLKLLVNNEVISVSTIIKN